MFPAWLRLVNAATANIDGHGAAQVMPPEIRRDVQKPILKREALESLRGMLEGVLREQE
ncbi:MAG: hypothetical protein M1582_04890 [Actinobacteria bacterium]|nr:hypothetical protein [Actinomycetota bacterium]